MDNSKPPLALIGGEGKMPHLILEEARSCGEAIFLLAIKGITSKELARKADDVVWFNLTQLGKGIKECQKRGVKAIVMGGRVHNIKALSLSLLKMDYTTLKLYLKLPDKRPDTLLSGIADCFAKKGINLMSSVGFLKKHLAKEGVLTKKSPSKPIMEDILFGAKLAKEMGGLDIGQTVVVKKGVVIAVEAAEGTDRCLERAGQLAGKDCVVVKMSKPNQDMRFDVPVIGINTIEKLHKINASAIAIESNRTLLIDEETISKADELGIIIVALPGA